MKFLLLFSFFVALSSLPVCTPFVAAGDPQLEKLKTPEGFSISLYAKEVTNARAMALGDKGTVFVGSFREGNLYALVDEDNDHKADKTYTLATDLQMPVGVAFRKGSLYVSAVSKVLRFDDIENNLENPPKPVVVTDQYPTDTHHGWKYIAFGPDDKLYVPVGAPCNICEKENEIYSTITRMNPDGSDIEVFAHGVRNSVGFDWHPTTNELWFTDNGRDWLGDNSPEDELNRAPEKGMHFGYPYCHAGEVSDPKFGDKRSCDEFTPPAQKLGPHVAALGMLFYTGNMFPEEYKNQILICEHGSWNRSKPIGYQVSLVKHDDKKGKSYEPFITGWLQEDDAWGRPVALLQMPDGSVLLSDDKSGMIYRITYNKTNE